MASCPKCNTKGHKVKHVTLEHLLRPEAQPRIADTQYYVCETANCPVVYFAPDGPPPFQKQDLMVRFGLKEHEAPRPLCYCFGHSVEEIEADLRERGQTQVLESIQADMKGDGCHCEQTNPLGRCCLASVRGAIAAAGARLGLAGEAAAAEAETCACCASEAVPASDTATDEPACDCCAPEGSPANSMAGADGRAERRGALAVGGSIIAAVLSSACCWLPLLLLAFGTSAAGVAGFFAQWRWPLIGVAVVLLGFGFWSAYRPVAAQAACCRPRRWRLQRGLLWVSAVFVAAAGLFPNYLPYVLGQPQQAAAMPVAAKTELTIPVAGMHCEGCATLLTNELSKVPGVAGVTVTYEGKQARVRVGSDTPAMRSKLIETIDEAGYAAEAKGIEAKPISGERNG